MNVPSVLKDSAECLGTLGSTFHADPLDEAAIRHSLETPVWGKRGGGTVFDIVQPGESVCLVVSDQTRRTAVHLVLPILLDGLEKKGCSVADMFFLFACGIHRPPTAEETAKILGPAVARTFEGRIFAHNPDEAAGLVEAGVTRRGHHVRVNRRALEADRLVLLGAASYHYHAGFGGGRKMLVPGLAARMTIAYNHSLTLDPVQDRIHPGVDIGRLDGNPVAKEMLEGARLCEPDILINTVLTPDGKLVGLFSGDLDLAHREACKLVEKASGVPIARPADLVVASAGVAPNWVQSHKSQYNAHRAVRPEGRVILDAPCPEGIGDERFRYWLKQDKSVLFRELRKSPEVLGQTAISTRTRGPSTILVTRLKSADLADLAIPAAPDLEAAGRMVLEYFAGRGIRRPTYYLMPDAGYTVPFLASGADAGRAR